MKYRNALTRPLSKPNKPEPFRPKGKRDHSNEVKPASPLKNTTPLAMPPPPMHKVNVKKAMLVFSRIQNKLHLKFETLFRAVALYKTYQSLPPAEQAEIPEEYLLTACMFVAMKYEEIYPPQLSRVMVNIRHSNLHDKEEYRRHERGLLLALEGDLDVPTPCTILDEMLVKTTQDKATYFYAYFLLELGLMSDGLAAMDFKQVCQGVVHVMTGLGDFLKQRKSPGSASQFKEGDECINASAREIIKARYLAIENETAIYKKYTQECYMRVADKTIFIASN